MIPNAIDTPQADNSEMRVQQEIEVRRARMNLVEAEESRNLAELALQYNNLQAEDTTWNAHQSFLSAIRASALTRARNIERGAQTMEHIKKAKVSIAATREKEQQEEREREKLEKEREAMQRPASSPVLWLPSLRSLRPCLGQQPSSAPARTTSDDEMLKQEKDRWIQYVRESFQTSEKRRLKRTATGVARSTSAAGVNIDVQTAKSA
jgi:hypothetical protein